MCQVLRLKMGDGSGCGGCDAEKDLDDITCHCKQGYINKEGTFVPGSSVRSGNALSKEDYEQHKKCKICPSAPTKCPFRREHLARVQRSRPSGYQPEYIEFFVPSKDISPKILEAYLRINGGSDQSQRGGKTFKVSPQPSLCLLGADGRRIRAKEAST